MNILLIDTITSGHHLSYIKALAEGLHSHAVIMLPQEEAAVRFKENSDCIFEWILSADYKVLLKQVKRVVKSRKIDIIHFVYADAFLKYWGLGIDTIKKASQNNCAVIMTFHQMRCSWLRDAARKRIFSRINCGIIHTESLFDRLISQGINNIVKIEYPRFQVTKPVRPDQARNQLGIKTDHKVLLAVGGTRYDKGLDLLLTALNKVHKPFYLIIAGRAEDFDYDFIRAHTQKFKDNVKILLKFLSDEEFSACISACDYVVIPYRKTFDGASGPLCEGVAQEKIIIGPNHGSLGTIIKKNHLGYTFQSESVESLEKALDSALTQAYSIDSAYQNYRNLLAVKNFVDSYETIYEAVITS